MDWFTYDSGTASPIDVAPCEGICGSQQQAAYVAGINPLLPIINSGTQVSGLIGDLITYTITAENGPTAFYVIGLPAWLSFDGVNIVSGIVPNNAPNGSFLVIARNAYGEDRKRVFSNGIDPWTFYPVIPGYPYQINPNIGVFYTKALTDYPTIESGQHVFALFPTPGFPGSPDNVVDDFFQVNAANVINLLGGPYYMVYDGTNVSSTVISFTAPVDEYLKSVLDIHPFTLYEITDFWSNIVNNVVTGYNDPAIHAFLADFQIAFYSNPPIPTP